MDASRMYDMRVVSKVGKNLPSKFAFSNYLLCMRWTDRRAKATLIVPFPMGGGILIRDLEQNVDVAQL